MPARNLTYRPAAQSTAAARPSPDGGWRVVFPPAAGSHNPRRRETTRVAPFAHLHIGSFANLHIGSFANLHIGSFANSLKFSFSAKERDTETGLSYFGSRYYSSDLSLWLSVDPMSGKYPSLSPYVYCANNPVKLVDPNGEKVIPLEAFQNSSYYESFQKLSQTNTYQKLLSGYQDDSHDFTLDYSTEFTKFAGMNKMWYTKRGNVTTYTKANSKYFRPNGYEQSEIAKVATLLHEAVHAVDGLTFRKTPNHDGFDRSSVLAGLLEYNSTYNLGYSSEDLEILSWKGLQNSVEYHDFIKNRAEKSDRTFEEEDNFVKSRITVILLGADLDE